MDLLALPVALHIPDGFLSGEVAAAGAVVAIAAVAFGLRVADRELDDARVPLLGVLAAFVFAAQMLNFPVAGGTSGHFLGATLAAVLLGPWVACLVMAVVIAAQALAFADGGVTRAGRQRGEHGRAGRAARGLRGGGRAAGAAARRAAVLLGAVGGRLVGRGDGRRGRHQRGARGLRHGAARAPRCPPCSASTR